MDLRRLRAGEWIAGVGGLVLLASLFTPWYQGDSNLTCVRAPCPSGVSLSAWQAFAGVDVVLCLTGLVGVSLLVLTATQPTGAIPVATEALVALFTVVAAMLAVFRLLVVPEAEGLPGDLEREPGLYVGVLAAGAVAVGAWLGMSDERVRGPVREPRWGGVEGEAEQGVAEVRLLPTPPRSGGGDTSPSGPERRAVEDETSSSTP